MATYTRDQLVDEAIRKLMVVGSGQSPDAEDQELVNNKIPALVDELASDGVCTIHDMDAIPGELFDAVASLLANLCATDFGRVFDPNAVDFYERRLRRLNAAPPVYTPLKTEYF